MNTKKYKYQEIWQIQMVWWQFFINCATHFTNLSSYFCQTTATYFTSLSLLNFLLLLPHKWKSKDSDNDYDDGEDDDGDDVATLMQSWCACRHFFDEVAPLAMMVPMDGASMMMVTVTVMVMVTVMVTVTVIHFYHPKKPQAKYLFVDFQGSRPLWHHF